MDCTVVIDSKTVRALGVAVSLVILAVKLDPSAAEKVLAYFGGTFAE